MDSCCVEEAGAGMRRAEMTSFKQLFVCFFVLCLRELRHAGVVFGFSLLCQGHGFRLSTRGLAALLAISPDVRVRL